MKEVACWHPRINCYQLTNDNLMLVSEKGALSLTSLDFPFFNLIDGESTVDEIISTADMDISQSARFRYQIEILIQQNIICWDDDCIDEYVFSSQVDSEINLSIANPSIVNYSSLNNFSIREWVTILSSDFFDLHNVDVILVDRFLGFEGKFNFEKRKALFVKVSGQEVWISPVMKNRDADNYLSRMEKIIYANNPSLAFLKDLFPEVSSSIPLVKDKLIASGLVGEFKIALGHHLKSEENNLFLFDKDRGELSYHSLEMLIESGEEFKKQVISDVVLNTCSADFNRDGGARSVSPETTVKRLKKFVSPVTGVITHLKELDGNDNNPVKIYETAFFKVPAAKDVQKIGSDSFVQRCLGKGVTHIQSQASALCEAVERYSALYQGNEPLFLSSQTDLDKRSYNFQDLVPYSDSQYQKFCDPTDPDSSLKQAACRYNGEQIRWLPAWSLTENEQVYVPLTSCFSNIPFEDDRFARWHSNGCAAGNTLEEAILQALFELTERDAAAIWWYNQIERPQFDISKIDPEYLAPLKETLSTNHEFWVLDLTHDIGIPVMAAIGKNRETKGISFGFGCHLNKALAAQRALTELCQLIPIRDQNGAPFDFNAVEDGPYLYPSKENDVEPSLIESSGDLKDDILAIVERLGEMDMEVLVLNYSREPLPVKTAKVFVPGLCHIWPQFANERLYRVPVSLEWASQARTEATVNPQALYI